MKGTSSTSTIKQWFLTRSSAWYWLQKSMLLLQGVTSIPLCWSLQEKIPLSPIYRSWFVTVVWYPSWGVFFLPKSVIIIEKVSHSGVKVIIIIKKVSHNGVKLKSFRKQRINPSLKYSFSGAIVSLHCCRRNCLTTWILSRFGKFSRRLTGRNGWEKQTPDM